MSTTKTQAEIVMALGVTMEQAAAAFRRFASVAVKALNSKAGRKFRRHLERATKRPTRRVRKAMKMAQRRALAQG